MSEDTDDFELPPSLRLLRTLVIILTVVMIGGVITVVGLLVTRLQAPSVTVPEALVLPDGADPLAITQGADFWAVVTQDNRILIFDGNGTLTQTVDITR